MYAGVMFSRPRIVPAGFIRPASQPKPPDRPTGDAWLHEIKHDGFRVIARKDGPRARLYSRLWERPDLSLPR